MRISLPERKLPVSQCSDYDRERHPSNKPSPEIVVPTKKRFLLFGAANQIGVTVLAADCARRYGFLTKRTTRGFFRQRHGLRLLRDSVRINHKTKRQVTPRPTPSASARPPIWSGESSDATVLGSRWAVRQGRLTARLTGRLTARPAGAVVAVLGPHSNHVDKWSVREYFGCETGPVFTRYPLRNSPTGLI